MLRVKALTRGQSILSLKLSRSAGRRNKSLWRMARQCELLGPYRKSALHHLI